LKGAQTLGKDAAIMVLPPAMKAELDYAAAQARETAMAAQQGREAVQLQRK
jgi:hypothetical protein